MSAVPIKYRSTPSRSALFRSTTNGSVHSLTSQTSSSNHNNHNNNHNYHQQQQSLNQSNHSYVSRQSYNDGSSNYESNNNNNNNNNDNNNYSSNNNNHNYQNINTIPRKYTSSSDGKDAVVEGIGTTTTTVGTSVTTNNMNNNNNINTSPSWMGQGGGFVDNNSQHNHTTTNHENHYVIGHAQQQIQQRQQPIYYEQTINPNHISSGSSVVNIPTPPTSGGSSFAHNHTTSFHTDNTSYYPPVEQYQPKPHHQQQQQYQEQQHIQQHMYHNGSSPHNSEKTASPPISVHDTGTSYLNNDSMIPNNHNGHHNTTTASSIPIRQRRRNSLSYSPHSPKQQQQHFDDNSIMISSPNTYRVVNGYKVPRHKSKKYTLSSIVTRYALVGLFVITLFMIVCSIIYWLLSTMFIYVTMDPNQKGHSHRYKTNNNNIVDLSDTTKYYSTTLDTYPMNSVELWPTHEHQSAIAVAAGSTGEGIQLIKSKFIEETVQELYSLDCKPKDPKNHCFNSKIQQQQVQVQPPHQTVILVRSPGSLGGIFEEFVREYIDRTRGANTDITIIRTSHIDPDDTESIEENNGSTTNNVGLKPKRFKRLRKITKTVVDQLRLYHNIKATENVVIIRLAIFPILLEAADLALRSTGDDYKPTSITLYDIMGVVRQLLRWQVRISHYITTTTPSVPSQYDNNSINNKMESDNNNNNVMPVLTIHLDKMLSSPYETESEIAEFLQFHDDHHDTTATTTTNTLNHNAEKNHVHHVHMDKFAEKVFARVDSCNTLLFDIMNEYYLDPIHYMNKYNTDYFHRYRKDTTNTNNIHNYYYNDNNINDNNNVIYSIVDGIIAEELLPDLNNTLTNVANQTMNTQEQLNLLVQQKQQQLQVQSSTSSSSLLLTSSSVAIRLPMKPLRGRPIHKSRVTELIGSYLDRKQSSTDSICRKYVKAVMCLLDTSGQSRILPKGLG